MLQRRFPKWLPLLEVFCGVHMGDLSLVLPKTGNRWACFPHLWKKTDESRMYGRLVTCHQPQHCVHLMKENQKENAEGLSQTPLRDMPVHPGPTKIHLKPVGDFWGLLSLYQPVPWPLLS